MVRDKIGGFKEREDMELWLNNWISKFCCDSKSSEEMKAKFPLAAAEVKVEEVAGNLVTTPRNFPAPALSARRVDGLAAAGLEAPVAKEMTRGL